MNGDGVTRRDVNRGLLSLAGMAAVGGVGGVGGWMVTVRSVSAQPSKPGTGAGKGAPPPPPPGVGEGPKSFLDAAWKKDRARDWTLKVALALNAYQTPGQYIQPNRQVEIRPFDFQTAALLFPVLASTGTSETDVEGVSSVLRFDGRELPVTPVFDANYPCGARFGRWDMRDMKGREITLDVDVPMTSWEMVVDEAALAKAVWPAGNKWPALAQSTFRTQMVGHELAVVDPGAPVVAEAVSTWCNRKPPQSIPPLELAKYLAGKVLETIQPSGQGYAPTPTGMWTGFDLKGAAQTMRDGQGSEHDIACVLASVYRNAGIPCRTVIGLYVGTDKGGDRTLGKKRKDDLRSWVEFCVYDETADRMLWLPVDVMRQRKSGNKAPPMARKWDYFANNKDTDYAMPIAFQYHPPTTVVAYGAPALWGWFTTPEVQVAEQTLRFNSITTPKTAVPPQRTQPGR